jgi:hypothetical protein
MPCGSWTTILPREKAPFRHDDPDRVGPLPDEPLLGDKPDDPLPGVLLGDEPDDGADDGVLDAGDEALVAETLPTELDPSPADEEDCTLADVAEWIVPDAQLLPADGMLPCTLDKECTMPDAQLLPADNEREADDTDVLLGELDGDDAVLLGELDGDDAVLLGELDGELGDDSELLALD